MGLSLHGGRWADSLGSGLGSPPRKQEWVVTLPPFITVEVGEELRSTCGRSLCCSDVFGVHGVDPVGTLSNRGFELALQLSGPRLGS